jgi:hypothetical protein
LAITRRRRFYGVIEILRIESYNLTIQSRNIDASR